MKPHPRTDEQDDLLRPRLTEMIDLRHALAKLEKLIDWEFFETEWASFFPATTGRPATSPRLVAGLLYLPTCLSSVRRRRRRPMGREPLLPALHR